MPNVNRTLSEETKELIEKGKVAKSRVESYYKLLDRIEKELLPHEVIVNNQFTAWFKNAELTLEQVRNFLVQFSVFSNLFLEAQLKKTINAPNLEAMRSSKEILMNELGVVFRNPASKSTPNKENVTDDDLVQSEGTVDGGTFRFPAAHFEWMLRMNSHVGLGFNDIGKRRHGNKSTLFFCDELSRLYGSDDPDVGLGASFAVENWAAAGFWKELIQGLDKFKKKQCPNLPLAYFLWHDRVEDQHAAHTWDELQEEYFSVEFNEDKFIQSGKEMLNGVLAFWKGLDEDRKKQ